MPRLSHINSAVVLSAVKVVVKMLEYVTNNDYQKTIVKKLSPPIVSMLNGPPEQTYVTLRNINFILQKVPHLLDKDVKVFFCNFEDPYYVKLEKLEIVTRLSDAKNYEVVLNELFEYSTQFDIDFVRRAIRGIGKVALRVDRSVEHAINILMNLFKEAGKNSPHIIQEVTTVMGHIYRKFPAKWNYLNSLNEIVANISEIIEPEAKASVVWMIGEYADKIESSDEFMMAIVDGFL